MIKLTHDGKTNPTATVDVQIKEDVWVKIDNQLDSLLLSQVYTQMNRIPPPMGTIIWNGLVLKYCRGFSTKRRFFNWHMSFTNMLDTMRNFNVRR